jgi:hypothetical protein
MGGMQRQVSPIPPGRYWICVVGKEKQRDFDLWIQDMRGGIKVETSSLNDQDPPTEFVIFKVPEGRSPFLDASYFGYPNIAEPAVHYLEDVEQTHREPNAIDKPMSSWFQGLEGWQTIALVIAAFLLLRGRSEPEPRREKRAA